MMDDIQKFTLINKLKSIYRANSVGERKESSAEHTWSAMVLADFLFDAAEKKMDKQRVFELLLYHDLVEIEAGDVPIHEEHLRKDKHVRERKAAEKLRSDLPFSLAERFWSAFKEFEDGKTIEAKFAKAIDLLDAQVHELDYKSDWKGYTRTFLEKKKGPYFKEFPVLDELFVAFLDHLENEGYFSQ